MAFVPSAIMHDHQQDFVGQDRLSQDINTRFPPRHARRLLGAALLACSRWGRRVSGVCKVQDWEKSIRFVWDLNGRYLVSTTRTSEYVYSMPSPDPLIDVEKRSPLKKIYPPVNSTPRNLVSRKPMMQLAFDLESSNPESPDTPPPLKSIRLRHIKT